MGVDLLNPDLFAIDLMHPILSSSITTGGRPIVNLEPVDLNAKLVKNGKVVTGRQVNVASLQAAESFGLDFICLTAGEGNPGLGNHRRPSAKQAAFLRFSHCR